MMILSRTCAWTTKRLGLNQFIFISMIHSLYLHSLIFCYSKMFLYFKLFNLLSWQYKTHYRKPWSQHMTEVLLHNCLAETVLGDSSDLINSRKRGNGFITLIISDVSHPLTSQLEDMKWLVHFTTKIYIF